MDNIVNLEDYRKCQDLEKEYQQFLVHVNKYVGIPTSTPELCKCFYYIIRYLEGTVNCFETLSLINGETEISGQLRHHLSTWLDEISNSLKKY